MARVGRKSPFAEVVLVISGIRNVSQHIGTCSRSMMGKRFVDGSQVHGFDFDLEGHDVKMASW